MFFYNEILIRLTWVDKSLCVVATAFEAPQADRADQTTGRDSHFVQRRTGGDDHRGNESRNGQFLLLESVAPSSSPRESEKDFGLLLASLDSLRGFR